MRTSTPIEHERPEEWGWHGEMGKWGRRLAIIPIAVLLAMIFGNHQRQARGHLADRVRRCSWCVLLVVDAPPAQERLAQPLKATRSPQLTPTPIAAPMRVGDARRRPHRKQLAQARVPPGPRGEAGRERAGDQQARRRRGAARATARETPNR